MFIKVGNDIIKVTAFDKINKYSTSIYFYKLGIDGRVILATSVEFKTEKECEEQWYKIADALIC